MPTISLTEFDDPIDAGGSASSMCNVKGDPPFEIYWKKDGLEIDSFNNGILITRSGQRLSLLNIESAQPRHAGNFTCVVKSQAGIIEETTGLRVNGTYKKAIKLAFLIFFLSFVTIFILS